MRLHLSLVASPELALALFERLDPRGGYVAKNTRVGIAEVTKD